MASTKVTAATLRGVLIGTDPHSRLCRAEVDAGSRVLDGGQVVAERARQEMRKRVANVPSEDLGDPDMTALDAASGMLRYAEVIGDDHICEVLLDPSLTREVFVRAQTKDAGVVLIPTLFPAPHNR